MLMALIALFCTIMWDHLTAHFSRFPAQARVARLLLKHGFAVRDGGIWAGTVPLSDTGVAAAANVDRRVVKATVRTIEEDPSLRPVFGRLQPTCMLKDAALALRGGVLEIVPTNAGKPGILAGVAEVIARRQISVRQAIVEDPELTEEPRLYIITETPIPHDALPEIQAVDGVREVVIGRKAR